MSKKFSKNILVEKKNLEGNKEGNRETVSLGNRETAVPKIRGKQGNRETAILTIGGKQGNRETRIFLKILNTASDSICTLSIEDREGGG